MAKRKQKALMLYMIKKYKYQILIAILVSVVIPSIITIGSSLVHATKQKENKQENINPDKSNRPDHVIIGSVKNIKIDKNEKILIMQEKKSQQINQVVVADDVKLVGQDKKILKIGAIKLKDLIAVVSTENEKVATDGAKFKIKKIFIKEASSSAKLKRKAVQGIVTSISGNLLTLAHQIHRDRIYQVTVDTNTFIKIKEASESANSSDLSIGMRIVAVGDLAEGGGIIAKRIHVIPGKSTGIEGKYPLLSPSATPSAAPTSIATPSGTITITPTSTPSASP